MRGARAGGPCGIFVRQQRAGDALRGVEGIGQAEVAVAGGDPEAAPAGRRAHHGHRVRHAGAMARVALSYAMEHLDKEQREFYRAKPRKS